MNGVIAGAVLAQLEQGAITAAAAISRRAVKHAIAPLHQAGNGITSIAVVETFQDGVNGVIAGAVLAQLENSSGPTAAPYDRRAVKRAIAPRHQTGIGSNSIAKGEVFQDGVNGETAAAICAQLEHGAGTTAAAIHRRSIKCAVAPRHQTG